MPAPASVNIARLLYLLVCEAAGVALALSTKGTSVEVSMTMGLIGGLLVGGFFILVESLMKGFTLRGFSTAIFGLLIGLFCAFLLTRVGVSELATLALGDQISEVGTDLATTITLALNTVLYASLGFLGAVLALRSSRDDFAFILPYVRFRQDSTTGRPIVLDAETIIDGRVPAINAAGFLHGRLVVPRFVLDELEVLAHSPKQENQQRGQRGLNNLEAMQGNAQLQVSIEESAKTAGTSDAMHSRLMQVAELLGARLMTSDESLTKVAKLRGLDVLNLNELVDALKPTVIVGERIRLPLVRAGKDEHQAVGYLSDGTMIVVNHAADRIGRSEEVIVISTLQTATGQMVFAELVMRD